MADLHAVKALGQQIWLDNLSRSLLHSGELAARLAQGVSGVTSNPAIFFNAFRHDDAYRDDITALQQQDLTALQRYERLAVADVQTACDVFAGEYATSGHRRGFVSLEVSPDAAHNTAATVAEAKHLWAAIDRPNAMIKVPATDAGLAALTELVAAGINVNLTLLFSRAQTLKAYRAHLAGLQQRQQAGQSLDRIYVVASFFLSRIDTALDATLPASLQGRSAIALAKAAYHDWQAFYAAAEWADVAAANAQPVSLLWASTGTKNKAYPDTLYVDSLIGAHTVNTVPEATLAAFIDHGNVAATLTQNSDEALALLRQIEELGIDVESLATRLQQDGLRQFEEAFAQLLAIVA